jgi:hypothetical protein
MVYYIFFIKGFSSSYSVFIIYLKGKTETGKTLTRMLGLNEFIDFKCISCSNLPTSFVSIFLIEIIISFNLSMYLHFSRNYLEEVVLIKVPKKVAN